ncbi:hypothetical protein CTheo_1739 [Ceratobasidium theobromae]|uniref:Uncharacterized protein n=1 Tax=Ceratobasidium theobromae TaxID=1582974 RepID=A0A5N5QSP9_9AGAM|nr:hypothetical protein CTheo_1739 [Ceratobasidium theobromae]
MKIHPTCYTSQFEATTSSTAQTARADNDNPATTRFSQLDFCETPRFPLLHALDDLHGIFGIGVNKRLVKPGDLILDIPTNTDSTGINVPVDIAA